MVSSGNTLAYINHYTWKPSPTFTVKKHNKLNSLHISHIPRHIHTTHVCTHLPDVLNNLQALLSDSVNSDGMFGCWELSHSWLYLSLTTTLWERGHHRSSKTELRPRGMDSTAQERQQVPEQELKSSFSDSEFHSVSNLLYSQNISYKEN